MTSFGGICLSKIKWLKDVLLKRFKIHKTHKLNSLASAGFKAATPQMKRRLLLFCHRHPCTAAADGGCYGLDFDGSPILPSSLHTSPYLSNLDSKFQEFQYISEHRESLLFRLFNTTSCQTRTAKQRTHTHTATTPPHMHVQRQGSAAAVKMVDSFLTYLITCNTQSTLPLQKLPIAIHY